MLISIDNIPSHNIDKNKWDECVSKSAHGLIYATAPYLDAMCDNWNGIVVNDYEAVMPLPWRKKLAVRYTYHVPFIQQLGWIGKIDSKLVKEFVKLLFSFCKYGEYAFNYSNNILPHTPNSELRNNFIIDLNHEYKFIKSNYKADLNYNLKKADKENLQYKSGSIDEAILLFQSLYGKKLPNIRKADFKNFKKFCASPDANYSVIVRSVSDANEHLLAIALLLKDNKRLYNVMNSTTNEGRKTEANHFLFDCILQEFAEHKLILDLEGSDVPGIQIFYQKFGAVNQPYYKLHFNNLPLPWRLLKR